RVAALRAARAGAPELERPDMVAVERRPGREGSGNGEVGLDRRDMRDRGLLQVEHRRVLAAVRDLDHCSPAAVVEKEGLVAFAAEVGDAAAEAEELRCDPRSVLCAEPRRRRVEDGTHHRPMLFARASPGAALRAVRGSPKSLVRAKRLPLSREDRSPMPTYVSA